MASRKDDPSKYHLPPLNIAGIVLTPAPEVTREIFVAPRPAISKKSPQPLETQPSYRGQVLVSKPRPQSMGTSPPKLLLPRRRRPKSLGNSPSRRSSPPKPVGRQSRPKSIGNSPSRRTTSKSGTRTKSKHSKSSEAKSTSKSPVKRKLKNFRVYRGNIRGKKKIVTQEDSDYSDEESIWPRLTALSSLLLDAPPSTPARGLPTDHKFSSFFRSCSKVGSLPSLNMPDSLISKVIISPSSQDGIYRYFIDKKAAIPLPELPPRPPPRPPKPPTPPPKEPSPPPRKLSPPEPSKFAPLPDFVQVKRIDWDAIMRKILSKSQPEAESEMNVYPPLNYLSKFYSTSPLPEEVPEGDLAEHVLLSEFIFMTNIVHNTIINLKRYYPQYYLLTCRRGKITELYDTASSTADVYTTEERKFATERAGTNILLNRVEWITESSWPPPTFSICFLRRGSFGIQVTTTRRGMTFYSKIWLRKFEDVIFVEKIQAVYILINGVLMLLGIAGIRIHTIRDVAIRRMKDELLDAFDNQSFEEEMLLKFRFLRRCCATIEAGERLLDIMELCRAKGLVWKIIESMYMFDDHWLMIKTGVVIDSLLIAASVRDSRLLIEEMASCFGLPNNKFYSTIEEFRVLDKFMREQMKDHYRGACLNHKLGIELIQLVS